MEAHRPQRSRWHLQSVVLRLPPYFPETGCDTAQIVGSVADMRSVWVRRRLIRIGTWVVLALALLFWAVSLAIEAPWTPWFTTVLWAVIGAGFFVRVVKNTRRKQSRLDAFHDLNEIYQGRTSTPPVDGTSAESAEIGHPFPGDRHSSPSENESREGDTAPRPEP